MKIEIPVTEKTLFEVLYKGDISYWGQFVTEENEDDLDRHFVVEKETGKAFEIGFTMATRGLAVLAKVNVKQFARILEDEGYNADPTTGDLLVQCAVFGKVKYG